jgi:hypothetical protein
VYSSASSSAERDWALALLAAEFVVALVLGLLFRFTLEVVGATLSVVVLVLGIALLGSGGGGSRILGLGRFDIGKAEGSVGTKGEGMTLDEVALTSFPSGPALDLGFSRGARAAGNVGWGIDEDESAVGKEDEGRDGGRAAGTA